MKVFISTDMEGISGITTIKAVTDFNSLEYQEGRKHLMADTNVAVNAAFDAGAKKVYVCDGHGAGNNFIKEELDKRAIQVCVQDLAWVVKDVDLCIMIGNHAMAGTKGAFLDHTQSSIMMHNYFYNGEKIGELMQMAVYVGHFGVPIVAVSGDKHACEEAKHFLGDKVATACVKVAKERNFAMCIPNAEAENLIYNTVKKGIENRADCKPMVMPLPFEVKIEFNRCDYCEDACKNRDDVERIDGYTARSVKNKIEKYHDVML